MYKILVADDETKIREIIKDYFSAKNFTVYLALLTASEPLAAR